MQHQQRYRGTTPVPSCLRSPTAGRALPTLTSSMALLSPTSATLGTSWLALRFSCASGISHGVVMCQDVKKVRGSSQRQIGQVRATSWIICTLSESFILVFLVNWFHYVRFQIPFCTTCTFYEGFLWRLWWVLVFKIAASLVTVAILTQYMHQLSQVKII